MRDSRRSPSYRDGVRHPLLVSLLVVVAGTVACAKTKEDALPPLVPTVPTTTTTLVDYSTVPLAAVASNTTTTVNQGPGRARLSGTVVGPDGAVVPLAVVRVERRGNTNVTIVMRPGGERIVTTVDEDGYLLRRSRILADGREIIIIDNRPRGPGARAGTGFGGFFVDVPAPVIRIPREQYIVETEAASPALI